MITEPISVVLVGLTDDEAAAIAEDDGFVVSRKPDVTGAEIDPSIDAVVLALGGTGPLDAIRDARRIAPEAAVVVVTDASVTTRRRPRGRSARITDGVERPVPPKASTTASIDGSISAPVTSGFRVTTKPSSSAIAAASSSVRPTSTTEIGSVIIPATASCATGDRRRRIIPRSRGDCHGTAT